jgi:hypothetical protein
MYQCLQLPDELPAGDVLSRIAFGFQLPLDIPDGNVPPRRGKLKCAFYLCGVVVHGVSEVSSSPGLGIELGYLARTLPKLNGVSIELSFCYLDCLLIVLAVQDRSGG